MYRTVWSDKRHDANEYGTKLVKSLVPGCKFDFPKSLYNVYDCLYAVVANDKEAIVLDFFGGSGTTAHAVLDLNREDNGNRQFILCEQMHYVDTVTRRRVRTVIEQSAEGEFLSLDLLPYNEMYMDKIQSARTSAALVKLWREIGESSFLNWYVNPEFPDEAVGDFKAIGKKRGVEAQKKLLCELLDKNQLYVHLTEIQDKIYQVSKADTKLNQLFYGETYSG